MRLGPMTIKAHGACLVELRHITRTDANEEAFAVP